MELQAFSEEPHEHLENVRDCNDNLSRDGKASIPVSCGRTCQQRRLALYLHF